MKKLILIASVVLTFSGCIGINKQISQIKALENCKYEIKSIDSVIIASVNINDLMQNGKPNLSKAPRLALAFLTKSIPLRANIKLAISNPSRHLAAINQFEYKIFMQKQQIAEGLVDQKVIVQANGGFAEVPIRINTNAYHLLNDEKTMEAITGFITGGSDAAAYEQTVTIQIKPTLDFLDKKIKYPGYITINKVIKSGNILKHIR